MTDETKDETQGAAPPASESSPRVVDATPEDASPEDASPEEAAPVDATPPSAGGAPADGGARAPDGEDDAPESKRVFPAGNALRPKSGLLLLVAGLLGGVLAVGANRPYRLAVPLAAAFALVATFGVFELLGSFDDPEERVAVRARSREVGTSLVFVTAAFVAFAGALSGAAAGLGPNWLWAPVVPVAFLLLVAAVFDLGVRLGPLAQDESGAARPLLRRHGFWVVATGALLYLPLLGAYSLWDPWETHYGLVAREILSRNDWISLWSTQEKWFWSKPILDFWLQALAMSGLGAHHQPGLVLTGVGGAAVARPEWAVRVPNALLGIGAAYLLYKGVARVFGRRPAMLGAMVLLACPQWYFVSRQTMTDMTFVGPMTGAMGLLLYGLNTPEDAIAKAYEVELGARKLRFTLWHVVFGAVLMCSLPQLVYLVTRNLELVLPGGGDGAFGFRPHFDEIRSGSTGNCGLPGNDPCVLTPAASIPRSLGTAAPVGVGKNLLRFFGAFEPSLQALVWGGVLAGLLYANWGERRTRRLVYIAAWLLCAVGTMGKGPVGFVMPVFCAFAYIAATKRWAELERIEILSGLLLLLVVALPWYVAMYVRHGAPFTDRLIIHDMFNRALAHVHDTNEGDDTGVRYYVWQLGYALFPWTALAPLGLLQWLRRGDSEGEGKGDGAVLLAMWFLFAFGLFSFMGTKFHHYILPAVPPAAMLSGIALDWLVGSRSPARPGKLPAYVALVAVGVAVATYGASRLLPGTVLGRAADPNLGLGAGLLAMGFGLCLAAHFVLGDRELPPAGDGARHDARMIGAAALGGATLLALVARDLVTKPEGADQPGAVRFLHLFTYNYRRPWPDSLDFGAVLFGLATVGVLAMVLLARPRLRALAATAFVALGLTAATWGSDVYMVQLAPHWGQRELMQKYYAERKSSSEPIVAYQMNWLGEYFYTGNHVPAFVSSGQTFQTWLKGEKDKGVTTMYFVTEHSRTGGLKSEVQPKQYAELTDKVLNNKFVLVRVEL